MEIVLIIATAGFVAGVLVGVLISAAVESLTDVSDINVGDIEKNKQKSL
ncbi:MULTISPECIES: hypothetical protein [unclassified Chryseobacterium]|nr:MULTISPECIES: hypothetical protein [unclassified Chryseobacterium]